MGIECDSLAKRRGGERFEERKGGGQKEAVRLGVMGEIEERKKLGKREVGGRRVTKLSSWA